MHVKFCQYLCIQYIYQQKKTDTFNTIKLKIGLRYPLGKTLVVKGKSFREQTKKTWAFWVQRILRCNYKIISRWITKESMLVHEHGKKSWYLGKKNPNFMFSYSDLFEWEWEWCHLSCQMGSVVSDVFLAIIEIQVPWIHPPPPPPQKKASISSWVCPTLVHVFKTLRAKWHSFSVPFRNYSWG